MTKPTIPNTVSLETAKRLEEARKAAGVEWPIRFREHVWETSSGLVIEEWEPQNGGNRLYPAPNVAELQELFGYSLGTIKPDEIADILMGRIRHHGPARNILLRHWAEKFPSEE